MARSIYTSVNKYIYVDTIRHILYSKFTDKFKNCPGVPLEDKRCQVSIDDIEKKFKYCTRRN